MLPLKRFASTALLLLAPVALHAQAAASAPITGAQRTSLLTSAKGRYYNLRTAGLKSFGCMVDINWQEMFIGLTGSPLPEDDARMKYFHASHLSFTGNLDDAPTLTWAPGATPPADGADKANQLRDSYSQMISGFFQAWLPSLNGSLISSSSTGTLLSTGKGYLLKENGDSAEVSDVTLDKDLLIQHLTTKSDALHTEMDTTFSPSANGLLLTALDTQYSQPATAPPTHLLMTTTFAPVNGFQLPASLVVQIPNVATFKMAFSHCTAEKQ